MTEGISPTVDRRTVVAAGGAGVLTSLAGCVGGFGSDGGTTMDFGSNYTEGTSEVFPIMQTEFMENVEAETDGEIEADGHLAGAIGDDIELAEQVQNNTIQAAVLSFSNLSMYSDPVDLVNIPYFIESNQEFVNMVTSDVWAETVVPEIREAGVEPMVNLLGDPRAIGFAEHIDDPALTPDGMEGIDHRIPASDMLAQIWDLAGANPTPVDWGETPSAMQEGVADSLDTTPLAYVSQGIHDILGDVVLTDHVQDAQVIIVSTEWLESLPDDLREGVERAAEQTFEANLEQVSVARENAFEEMEDVGVDIHELDDDEIDEWRDAVGHQRDEWDEFKEELAGDMETFEDLVDATQTQSDWVVDDYA